MHGKRNHKKQRKSPRNVKERLCGKEKDEEKGRWSLEALGGRSGVTAGKTRYRAAEQCGMIGWWTGIVQ